MPPPAAHPSLVDELLAAAVKPQSARNYLRALQGLHAWLSARPLRFTTAAEQDAAIAGYLSFCALTQKLHAQVGQCVLSGYAYIYPERKSSLPLSWRCLAAWQRNQVYGEGQPVSDGVLACIQDAMRQEGHVEEADALAVAHDCYLRQSDFLQLRPADIIFAGDEVAVLIRYAKTGPRQGVRVDWPGTAELLRRRVQLHKGSGPLFRTTAHAYGLAWSSAVAKLRRLPGCEALEVGPPHSVRHSGPARDAATGYRSIWQIQRRGRWQSESSVMRYAKTASWVAAVARTPSVLQQLGTRLLASRGLRDPQPKE